MIVVAGAFLAVAAGACVDMGAPSGSPAAISVVQAPALFVVEGQRMLDSTGAPAPLAVVAYDVHGNAVSGFTPKFFITDTTHLATIGPDAIVSGIDTGVVHVIGQIGDVQTPPLTLYVTEAPDTLVSTTAPGIVDTAAVGHDTTTARGSVSVGVQVQAADKSGVPGVFVRYSLAYVPDTLSGGSSSAVYLAGDDGKPSTLDTTAVGGSASRTLVVLTPLLADSTLRAGTRTDSVVVLAQVQYRGAPLPGSPLRITIPLVAAFKLK